jgi:diguanylate cyclase (GGDEF)-like protein
MTVQSKFSLTYTFATVFILLAGILVFGNYYQESTAKILQLSMQIVLASSLFCFTGMVIAVVKSAIDAWFIRAGWVILMFSYLFIVIGNIISLFFSALTKSPVFSYLFLASYSLLCIGILFIPSTPKLQKPRQRQYVDIIVFVLVSLIAVWIFLILPHVVNQDASLDQAITAIDYLLVFSVLDLLLRRKQKRFQKTSFLFALGVGTLVFNHLLLVLAQSGLTIQLSFLMYLSWLSSDAAFCIAAVEFGFVSGDQNMDSLVEESSRSEKKTDFLLPTVWVSLAYGVLVWTHYNPETVSFPVLAVGTGSLIIMLVIHLMETLKENSLLISAAHEEIKSRKTIQEKLWHDIRHDPLTALPNRAYLIDQLQIALDTTRDTNTVSSALIFLDLDRFKAINDSYGHSSGDELLKAVAERLIFCVRPGDSVTRLGGDEFAILLNNLQNSQTVYKIASRIMDKMKEPFEIEGNILHSGVSFGIAYIHSAIISPEDAIKEADKAMYSAKMKGRGQFEISGNFEF